MTIASSESKKALSPSFSSAADLLLEEKITSITAGTEGDNINEQIHYVTAQLRRVASESKENALTICDYIEAFVNETT